MEEFRTEQESFWAGDFGRDYIDRNREAALIASNAALFARALRGVGPIHSVVEFGANIGNNLKALQVLFPSASQRGVEINQDAASELGRVIGPENVVTGSILDPLEGPPADLVLSKGLLIHLDPSVLELAYTRIIEASSKFILICEYYNPTPIGIPYRGHENRLFKRDFAGEILDRQSDLELRDYGFVYRRDKSFALDDITWFLLARRGC
jgi:pseudaminic acid biosynthesis-associated methylase